MYILMMTAYTAVNVPYGAMLGVVTTRSEEKTEFSSYRMFFAYIGSFISIGIFSLFEKRVIGTVNASGEVVRGVGDAAPLQWTAVVGIVALLCAILFILCFALTREHVRKEAEQTSVRKDLSALLKNRPWWLLLGAGIGQLLFNSIRGGAAAYYFANVMGTGLFLTCAVFLAVGELSQMAGVLLATPVSSALGKRNSFMGALLLAGVLSLGIFFLPPTAAGAWGLLILQVLIGIACGITSPLIWSMFADVADYSAFRLGSDSTGLIFSSSSMSQKLGGALGGFLLLMILGAAGYDASLGVQSPRTLTAIKALMSTIPAAGAFLGCLCLVFYPQKKMFTPASLREELRSELTGRILPFWQKMRDPAGGFFGEADGFGRINPEAPRGTVLNARILWAFSEAGRQLDDPAMTDSAKWARDYFLEHFFDREYGGVWWSVDSSGKCLDDKKQLYAQAFAIYGLSAWCRAVPGDSEALEAAKGLFRLVLEKFKDLDNGGYLEAFARDFTPLEDMSLSGSDINAPKTMNSHIHLMEAFAALYRVWPDAALEAELMQLLEIVSVRMTGPDGHLRLYFEKDWTPLPGPASPGHDIETSWLILECAGAVGCAESVRDVADRLACAGNSLFEGSVVSPYEQWWVYAEAVVGNLWLWKRSGKVSDFDRAYSSWNFIRRCLRDTSNGEWYWGLLPGGRPDTASPKAGFWKCPYHNSRMCLEAIRL